MRAARPHPGTGGGRLLLAAGAAGTGVAVIFAVAGGASHRLQQPLLHENDAIVAIQAQLGRSDDPGAGPILAPTPTPTQAAPAKPHGKRQRHDGADVVAAAATAGGSIGATLDPVLAPGAGDTGVPGPADTPKPDPTDETTPDVVLPPTDPGAIPPTDPQPGGLPASGEGTPPPIVDRGGGRGDEPGSEIVVALLAATSVRDTAQAQADALIADAIDVASATRAQAIEQAGTTIRAALIEVTEGAVVEDPAALETAHVAIAQAQEEAAGIVDSAQASAAAILDAAQAEAAAIIAEAEAAALTILESSTPGPVVPSAPDPVGAPLAPGTAMPIVEPSAAPVDVAVETVASDPAAVATGTSEPDLASIADVILQQGQAQASEIVDQAASLAADTAGQATTDAAQIEQAAAEIAMGLDEFLCDGALSTEELVSYGEAAAETITAVAAEQAAAIVDGAQDGADDLIAQAQQHAQEIVDNARAAAAAASGQSVGTPPALDPGAAEQAGSIDEVPPAAPDTPPVESQSGGEG